ncbi:BREX-1 system adenine-specific DNA-methyltransferase PglX [Bacillus salipaludis]|uniref:site-specific DNA-methyltransferase (adenine-specific) n=1 Tax=Bacillus salipaludis TaxID=2547811 RepID=A0AA90R855_9BACI|nr:BREX-1 system adenine-specific DNA-methyltransferase PglX [Bacillus salipaludis]MDQ6598101.1 BREX-1 system adenine-specific DNA-methyltransferase PglX [Bacillus salipaludis]
MNKKALKEFAIYARNELRSQIALRAQAFGITSKGSPVLVTGTDYVEINNKKYPLTYKKGLQRLLKEIETKGYDNVIEEVAYTWFNRLIAIRYMEVHNYLPSRVRVLSSDTRGKVDPDILTEYQYTDLPVNKDEIASMLGQGNREESFRKLLIAQCNELSEVMPFLFEKIEDYSELLLPESMLYSDSLVNKLGKGLDDENFQHVEVIGWLYQYYISEKKDEVFAGLKKNRKITKENIPAATQLFTPHWIVRFMIENSLGQMWLESFPESGLNKVMKYYVEPAEQEHDVRLKLEELQNPNLSPEDITILDPACGSGHILVYAFDLLYKIYEERGYSIKDIPRLILEKNLYGIDIDDRAAQLASFALMMKAREKTKHIFRIVPEFNIISIKESNNILIDEASEIISENENEEREIKDLLSTFIDAKNFGSIIQLEKINFQKYLNKLSSLKRTGEFNLENFEVYEQLNKIELIIKQGRILSAQYNVVVTNPPYMGHKGMGSELSNYAKKYYKDSKTDLYSIFLERCNQFTCPNGFHAEINQHSWMFLSSFENLRKKILTNQTILSMIHLGPRAFEEIGGEVVQSTAFVLRNLPIQNYIGDYFKLTEYTKARNKEDAFISRKHNYHSNQLNFQGISGSPIAYWASATIYDHFKNDVKLEEIASPKSGMSTTDNDRFLRFWYEVNFNKIGFNSSSSQQAYDSKKKWFPYNKGGTYRRWYGNQEYLVNWENDGQEIKAAVVNNPKDPNTTHWSRRIFNYQYFFKECITWSALSSFYFSARYSPRGFIFDSKGASLFVENKDDLIYLLSFLQSKVARQFLAFLSPTLDFSVGQIKSLPLVDYKKIQADVNKLAQECIILAQKDWDSFETSWEFNKHPFMATQGLVQRMEGSYTQWKELAEKRFYQIQQNEEELNKIFINLYSLKDELIPEVPDDEVTVRLADRDRDARSFLSYCIGLMMGRYSLDVEGLAYAGGVWDTSKYKTFQPDSDGIIPLTDTEYFEDDVVARIQMLLVILFGQDTLAENLRWLAESLTMKANETPGERLRRYFFDEFYADHCKIYQKRPIYWLAESGPKKGFRALFYLHRYTPETLATMRFSYVQNLQEKLRQEQKRLEQDLLNPELSVAMKKRYDKQLSTIKAQQDELINFDKKLAELANQRIDLDLDDGVMLNYGNLQNILAKIK